MKPLGLSQVQAAERLGISLNRLNEIVLGKRGITADTALRLSRLLKTSPQLWMRLQTVRGQIRQQRHASPRHLKIPRRLCAIDFGLLQQQPRVRQLELRRHARLVADFRDLICPGRLLDRPGTRLPGRPGRKQLGPGRP